MTTQDESEKLRTTTETELWQRQDTTTTTTVTNEKREKVYRVTDERKTLVE